MRTLTAVACSSLLLVVAASPVLATALPSSMGTRAMVFRLHVDGRASPRSTFWVAYGPLGGRFGIIRLHRAAPNLYVARSRLPRPQRADFAYVAGTGIVRTKHGIGPGDPAVTIRNVIVTRGQSRLPTVQWHMPVG